MSRRVMPEERLARDRVCVGLASAPVSSSTGSGAPTSAGSVTVSGSGMAGVAGSAAASGVGVSWSQEGLKNDIAGSFPFRFCCRKGAMRVKHGDVRAHSHRS